MTQNKENAENWTVRAVHEGHSVALRELFERYRPALYAYFMRRVRHTADADDLAQDVFVRLSRLDPSTNIRDAEGFIFQTAINLVRDRSRRARVQGNIDQLSALKSELADEEPGAQRVLEGKVELYRVIDALDRLSDRTRNIFVLRRLEQMKVEDIAVFYGISVSAVEHHITKAQAHLVKLIRRP